VKFGAEKSIFEDAGSGKLKILPHFGISLERFHEIFRVCGKYDARLNVKVLGIHSKGSGVIGFLLGVAFCAKFSAPPIAEKMHIGCDYIL